MSAVYLTGDVYLPFNFNATDLAGAVDQYVVSPIAGTIEELWTVVQATISTGGVITAAIGATDVVGDGTGSLLAITHANSDAVGVVDHATSTKGSATARIGAGAAIKIKASAAYNGGSAAVSGFVRVSGSSSGNPQAAG